MPDARPDARPEVVAFERRRFLLAAGALALVAGTTALVGRRLLETASSAAQRLGIPLPRPATPGPAGARRRVAGGAPGSARW